MTGLSDRQVEILGLIRCGSDTEDIAETLGLSVWTVRDHIRRIRGVLNVPARMWELPDVAVALGLELPDCDDL